MRVYFRIAVQWILLGGMVLSSNPAISQISGSHKDKLSYSIRYVRSDTTPLRDTSSFEAPINAFLLPYEKIVVQDEGTEWVDVIYPTRGFVNRHYLFTEAEVDQLYIDWIDRYQDLKRVQSGETPWMDIQAHPLGRQAFDASREWLQDDQHRVRMVRAALLNLRALPTPYADTLRQFEKWEKIIVDTTYAGLKHWDRVVFPDSGFVNNHYLYSPSQVDSLVENQRLELRDLLKAMMQTSINAPENKQEWRDCEKYGKHSYLSGNEDIRLIERTNQGILADSAVSMWWDRWIDQNENGIPGSASFNLVVQDSATDKHLRAKLFGRGLEEQDYQPVLLQGKPVIEPGDTVTFRVDGNNQNWQPGEYHYRLELFDAHTRDLVCVQNWLERDELGYLPFESEPTNYFQLSVMHAFSPFYIPVEGEFKQWTWAYGANIELSREKWPVSIGGSYNYLEAETQSGAFHLETNHTSFYLKYTPFKFFNDHLELFVNAGTTRWEALIHNVKYPKHDEYYKHESDKGWNIMGGGGLLFNWRNFLLGIQYQGYNSPLAVLGEPLNEPETQEELNEWVPTTQYKLYAGSHQLQVVLGYRFQRSVKK